MSSDEEIGTRVIDVIRRHLHAPDKHVHAQTRLIDDLGADSLALVEMTLVFEETFDIDIPDEEAERIRTVQDAIVSVEKSLRSQRESVGPRSGTCSGP
jgi:acyl carrier protein